MISEPERQPLTRAQLYDLVWSTPMSKLAKTFHCSDVWLARICEECDVPTPGRGYWAKKRAGKRANKRGLPKGADPHEIVLEFDPEPPTPAEQPPPPPPPLDADIAAMVEAFDKMGPLVVPEELSGPHPLVAEAKRALTNAIDTDRSRFGHLQPLWSKCDLSFNVGAESLDRALRLMDTLLRTFAKLKCPTTGPAEAYRRAPTEVLGEQFVFRLRERVRQRPFDPKKDKSTGPWDSPKIVCEPRGLFVCSGRSETDPPVAVKLTHPRARFHTGSAPVTEPLEVDFLASAGDLRRWR